MKKYVIILFFFISLFSVISTSVLRKGNTKEDNNITSIAQEKPTLDSQDDAVTNSIKEHKTAKKSKKSKSKKPIKQHGAKRNAKPLDQAEENNISNDSIISKDIDEINEINEIISVNNDKHNKDVVETSMNSTDESDNGITDTIDKNTDVIVEVDKSETKTENKANDITNSNDDIKSYSIADDTTKESALFYNTTKSNTKDIQLTNKEEDLKSKDYPNVFMIINSGNIEDNIPVRNYDAVNKRIHSKAKENINTKDLDALKDIVNIAVDSVISKIPDIFGNINEASLDSKKLFIIINSGNILGFNSDSNDMKSLDLLSHFKDNENNRPMDVMKNINSKKDVSNNKDNMHKITQDNIETVEISNKVKRELRPSIKVSFGENTDFDNNDNTTSNIDIDSIDFTPESNGLIDLAALFNEKLNNAIDKILNNSYVQKLMNYHIEMFQPIDESKIVIDLGEFEIVKYPIPVKIKMLLLIG